MDLESLRDHADECEAVAKERAETEGGGLHYMNTCDWAYAMAFRAAADEIERQRRQLETIQQLLTAVLFRATAREAVSDICEHKRLRRQCNECQLAQEVADLRNELTAARLELDAECKRNPESAPK